MRTVQDMLTELNQAGFSDADVGSECDNTPGPTINRLRNGIHAHTNYIRYAQIKACHRKLMARVARKIAA